MGNIEILPGCDSKPKSPSYLTCLWGPNRLST